MSAPMEASNEIIVRHARYADLDPVGDFFLGLSHASRFLRFLSGTQYLSPDQKRNLVTISPRQMVLLALAGRRVIGHIMAVFQDERTVDVALVVAEDHQRRGVGTWMIYELADTLSACGVTEVCAHVLAQNHVVMNWVQQLLTNIRYERSRESVTVYGTFHPSMPE